MTVPIPLTLGVAIPVPGAVAAPNPPPSAPRTVANGSLTLKPAGGDLTFVASPGP